MSVATAPSAPAGPLSQFDQQEVAAAHTRSKKIRKAAGVAAFNGWGTAICAVLSAPFAIFSVTSFIATAGLALVAYNEFRGRQRLLDFDRSAARFLGWNQVGFLALIVGYCVWMLYSGLTGEGPFAAEIRAKPELAMALDDIEQYDQLYYFMIAGVYSVVMGLSFIFQGLNAVYYFTRVRHIDEYVEETPNWVLDLQRLAK